MLLHDHKSNDKRSMTIDGSLRKFCMVSATGPQHDLCIHPAICEWVIDVREVIVDITDTIPTWRSKRFSDDSFEALAVHARNRFTNSETFDSFNWECCHLLSDMS